MIATFSQGDAAIIVGILTLIGILVPTFWAGSKAVKVNRAEHAINTEIGRQNAAKLDMVLENQGEIRGEMEGMKTDLGDIKAEISLLRATDMDHEGRVSSLEEHRRHTPPGVSA